MEAIAAVETSARSEEDTWAAIFAEHLIGERETSTKECLDAAGVIACAADEGPRDASRRRADRARVDHQRRFNTGPNRNLTRYVRP